MTKPQKQAISADDLYQLQVVSGCEMSPDGRFILTTVQSVDPETEKKYSHIWLISTDKTSSPKQFTFGKQLDLSPKWSPDGQTIAFLSNRVTEEEFQIYLIPAAGGEARPLTAFKGDFGSLLWSPDGQKLLCSFRQKDAAVIDREADEQKKKLGPVDRHITRIFYKLDGAGYLPQELYHLWLIDAESGEGKPLTEGQVHSEHSPSWSPDGQTLVFVSNRKPDPDRHPDADDLYCMDIADGALRKLVLPPGNKFVPSFSPDGKWIAYLTTEAEAEWWRNVTLAIVPSAGGERINLTQAYDFDASHWTINDVGGTAQSPPTWSQDGQRIYFQVAHHGQTSLKSIKIDGSDLQDHLNQGVVAEFQFDANQSKLAYRYANSQEPSQIFITEADFSHQTQLSHFNSFLAERDLGQLEEIWLKGSANNDIQGWLLKPPGFDPQ